MPTAKLSDGAQLRYRIDDFTDPWTKSETVVLMHGYCRNSNFWHAWVPVLARHFRVIRPDLRGCGRSDIPPPGFQWSLEQYLRDLLEFIDAIGCQSAHFIGESMGGMVMPYFADRHSARVKSIVACSSNLGVKGVMAKEMAAGAVDMTTAIKSAPTLIDYIRKTEHSRLHPDEVSPEGREWYANEWASTDRRVWHDWSEQIVPQLDLTETLLARVTAPLLFIAASRTVKLPLSEAQFWVDHVQNGRLAVVDSASQGLAFAKADECAHLSLDFLLGLR